MSSSFLSTEVTAKCGIASTPLKEWLSVVQTIPFTRVCFYKVVTDGNEKSGLE